MKITLLIAFIIPLATFANSSFDQVWQVVSQKPQSFTNSVEQNWADQYQDGAYPTYSVNLTRMINYTSRGLEDLLEKAVHRTLHENADFYPSLNKLLHSNGVCFQGKWIIDEASDYSGLFAEGTQVPLIARASVTLSGTKRDQKRGFAFALKLFPTDQRDAFVETQNVFLIDVLAGRLADSFAEASMSNEPELGFSFDLPLITHVVKTFGLADINPGFRPVDHLSRVDAKGNKIENSHGPRWIQIQPEVTQSSILRDDFRDELLDATKRRKLTYSILLSDESSDKSSAHWQRVGKIELSKSVVSYGCDRRLHFAHPRILK